MEIKTFWDTGVIYDKQDFFQPFLVNVDKTTRIACLSKNLVLRLIRIC